jgi:hypothetical protein
MTLFAALAAFMFAQAAPAPQPAPALLSAPAPPPFPQTMPGEILTAMASTQAALADVSVCFGEGAAVTPARLDALDNRMRALSARAAGIWGAQQQLMVMSAATTVPKCTGGGPVSLTRAGERLAILEAKLNAVTAPLQTGVWLGSMPLCRFGPVAHELLVDRYTAQPSLIIKLHPDAAGDLAALTGRQIGSALALRAGGRIVTEPVINEAITGGQIQISRPDQLALNRLSAALKSCPKPAPPAQL